MGKKHSKSKDTLSDVIEQNVPEEAVHPWESISSLALINENKLYIGDSEGVRRRKFIYIFIINKCFKFLMPNKRKQCLKNEVHNSIEFFLWFDVHFYLAKTGFLGQISA